MRRDDLLALTPDHLARLANKGLVNRATAEVDAGRGPEVEETEGTVSGLCPDGARVRIGRDPGQPLGTCTCGAAVCRHRLATVIVYQRSAPLVADPVGAQPWDPGACTDDEVLAACGADAVRRAGLAVRGSCVVTTEPGAVPIARLPACTVQFMVPRALAFARCDCVAGTGCEHVVLAVRAFRACPGGGVSELGVASGVRSPVLEQVERALVALVTRGLVGFGGSVELAEARVAAERAGYVWLADGLEELERQHEWYERQSARFDGRVCAELVGEVAARLRAGARDGVLPAGFVLGASEASETVVDTTRWVGLGARLEADGDRRQASVFLADPLTGEVLVAQREWTFPEGTAPNGPALGEKFASSRMSVAALAVQEVVVRGARRRANGRVDLGTARSMKATVYAGPPRWTELPDGLVVRDLEAHGKRVADRPPAALGPRRVASRVHVVGVEDVLGAGYSAADQEAVVLVRDPAGHVLRVRAAFRTVSPGAPGALLAAAEGGLQFVAGELRQRSHGWEMAAVGLALPDRLVAPDLAPERPFRAESLASPADDPVAEQIRGAASLVERGVHHGVASIAPGPVADRLEAAGMRWLAATVRGAATAPGFLTLAVAVAVAGER